MDFYVVCTRQETREEDKGGEGGGGRKRERERRVRKRKKERGWEGWRDRIER